ncbi:MAG: hypothetical protein ABSB53_03305 [Nitrososphaerales archaeon]|jgi:hypothetical protein
MNHGLLLTLLLAVGFASPAMAAFALPIAGKPLPAPSPCSSSSDCATWSAFFFKGYMLVAVDVAESFAVAVVLILLLRWLGKRQFISGTLNLKVPIPKVVRLVALLAAIYPTMAYFIFIYLDHDPSLVLSSTSIFHKWFGWINGTLYTYRLGPWAYGQAFGGYAVVMLGLASLCISVSIGLKKAVRFFALPCVLALPVMMLLSFPIGDMTSQATNFVATWEIANVQIVSNWFVLIVAACLFLYLNRNIIRRP